MGALLVTTDYGKEVDAAAEALDCLLPLDPGAGLRETGFGGLIILETSLDPDKAADAVLGCTTAHIRSIVPIDIMVRTGLEGIASAVLPAVAPGSRVAVRCRRRGSSMPSSKMVEEAVGKALTERGAHVDLRAPDLVVRIEIIGEVTAISVRPPERSMYRKSPLGDRV